MIYLDNAATSYPKPEIVFEEMLRCMKDYCANPGRGGHDLSIKSGMAVLEAREAISQFINCSNPMQICFTKNATEALNFAIHGILEKGDHVITSSMEHNSVMRPLRTAEKFKNITINIAKSDEFGELDIEDFKKTITTKTKLAVLTLSSNVTGIIMPIKEIGRICRENGVIFLLDGSQGSGSIKIDVQEDNIDILALPGHKGLLGPQGTGVLYVGKGIHLKPIIQGGTGSKSELIFQPELLPDAMESGTLNTPGIVGLKAGIEFIDSIGIENIKNHKNSLVDYFYNGVKNIQGIKLYNKKDSNSGIIALNLGDYDSSELSYILDKKFGICTRGGLHCSPMAHKTLGTLNTGIVRFSFSYFNNLQEIEYTIDSLEKISKGLDNI